MGVKFFHRRLIHQIARIPRRARLDLILRNVELDMVVGPVDPVNGIRRHQDMLSSPPVLSVDDEIPDVEGGAIDNEILDMADVAVSRVDVIACDFSYASQVRIAALVESIAFVGSLAPE